MRWFTIGFTTILVIGLVALVLLRGPQPAGGRADPTNERLVAQGRIVYGQYCASCHGPNLEGQPSWQEALPEGGRPAPPHDETGHTWHHADELLFEIVQKGPESSTLPGYVYRMPAFGGALSDDEIWAVLAYIKSTWPPDILAAQDEVNRRAR